MCWVTYHCFTLKSWWSEVWTSWQNLNWLSWLLILVDDLIFCRESMSSFVDFWNVRKYSIFFSFGPLKWSQFCRKNSLEISDQIYKSTLKSIQVFHSKNWQTKSINIGTEGQLLRSINKLKLTQMQMAIKG